MTVIIMTIISIRIVVNVYNLLHSHNLFFFFSFFFLHLFCDFFLFFFFSFSRRGRRSRFYSRHSWIARPLKRIRISSLLFNNFFFPIFFFFFSLSFFNTPSSIIIIEKSNSLLELVLHFFSLSFSRMHFFFLSLHTHFFLFFLLHLLPIPSHVFFSLFLFPGFFY